MGAAWVLGFRKKRELAAVALVNVVTNPPLNFFLALNAQYAFFQIGFSALLFLEALVVLAEWGALTFVFQGKSRKLFRLSLTMNAFSYLIGVIFF